MNLEIIKMLYICNFKSFSTNTICFSKKRRIERKWCTASTVNKRNLFYGQTKILRRIEICACCCTIVKIRPIKNTTRFICCALLLLLFSLLSPFKYHFHRMFSCHFGAIGDSSIHVANLFVVAFNVIEKVL